MTSFYPGAERRRAPRLAISLAASLRERGRNACSVRLVDLSALGCRLELGSDIPQGSWVWLRLPGIEPRFSRVAWSRGGFAGIEFETPLHEAVLDALVGLETRPSESDLDELRRISSRCRSLAARAAELADEEASLELLCLAADCDLEAGTPLPPGL